MADSNTLNPKKRRRIPVQARSIERVNKILDTASNLMAKRQDAKISTHLIAREAGVSVGSVYQFFPNVESVKIALIERLLDQYYERFDSTLTANPDISDLSAISDLLVEATYEFYQEHPDILALIVSSNGSEEFFTANQALNERVAKRMADHFGEKQKKVFLEDWRKITSFYSKL